MHGQKNIKLYLKSPSVSNFIILFYVSLHTEYYLQNLQGTKRFDISASDKTKTDLKSHCVSVRTHFAQNMSKLPPFLETKMNIPVPKRRQIACSLKSLSLNF